MLNGVPNVCDSLQLVNQLYAQFYFFQRTLLFSVLSLVFEMLNLVWNDYGKELNKKTPS